MPLAIAGQLNNNITQPNTESQIMSFILDANKLNGTAI